MTIAVADQITMYRNMVLIRRFEEGVAEAYADGFIGGFTHLYIGQEAVATGAITALNHDDYAIGTYRVHAHALVRGSSARSFMARSAAIFWNRPRLAASITAWACRARR